MSDSLVCTVDILTNALGSPRAFVKDDLKGYTLEWDYTNKYGNIFTIFGLRKNQYDKNLDCWNIRGSNGVKTYSIVEEVQQLVSKYFPLDQKMSQQMMPDD